MSENYMKLYINKFYNLYPSKVYKKNNEFYFFIKDIKFYLKEYTRKEEEINMLLKISNELYGKGIKVNTFVLNKDKKIFTEIKKKKYVLLRVNVIECEKVSLEDMVSFSERIILDNNRNEAYISERWKQRIDLLEKQVIEYNNEYPLLLKSFNYYVGLAENAISYIGMLKDRNVNEKLVLSHSRMHTSMTLKEIYDPTLFMFDFKSRDIASYIKNGFFKNDNMIDELENLIYNKKVSENECIIIIARMLYPDYYFDAIEKMIYLKGEEKEIIKIIKRNKDYEKLLEDIFNVLKRYFNIPEIKWLVQIK